MLCSSHFAASRPASQVRLAVDWCTREVATSVADIVKAGMIDDFLSALKLRPIPASKVRDSMLQAASQPPIAPASGSGTIAQASTFSLGSLMHGITQAASAPTEAELAAASRLTEILNDDGVLGPITGVMAAPLLDLMTAAACTGVADVDAHAFMALEKAEELRASGELGGTTIDEAASIALYTSECEFYRKLNRLLRDRDRTALEPFLPYLRLMLQARAKLPKYTQAVWRGVKGVDLTGNFPKGKKLFWWAFASTSKNVSALHNPMFCGESGLRTQFMIEASSGVDIGRFSMIASEAEVLLFPGTKLEVVDVANMGNGLHQVHLREVVMPVQLLK